MHDISPTELSAAARSALLNRRYPAAILTQLDALDPATLQALPWAALLQGRRLCRLHSRFAEATPLIDSAWAAFKSTGDEEGELWALAECLVMRYHAGEHSAGLALADAAIDRPMRPYL